MSTRLAKAGAIVAVAAATGAAIAFGGSQLATADSVTATTGVNIRSGPGTSYDIVGGLTAGQAVTAVGKPENGWVKVWFNGDSAFVSAKYLDLDGSVSDAPVQIHTDGIKISTAALNVRSGPGLDEKVIGYVSSGQKVTLTGKQSAGFAEVLYGGQRAWVTAQYLVSSFNDVPKTSGTKVATTDLLIRTSTDADFKIITTVHEGGRLQVTGKTSGPYAQVIYGDAARWVTAKYLSDKASGGPDKPDRDKSRPDKNRPDNNRPDKNRPDRDQPERKAPKPDRPDPLPDVVGTRYATTELLIRTTADRDYRTVATIQRGDSVKITGTSRNGRAQIIFQDKVRWVTAEYLAKSKPSDPPPADDGDSDDSGDDPSYDGGTKDVPNRIWDRLAMCEASGNWSINTGNGFYGGLQFTLQTWRGFGGSGMPHNASRLEQIRIAERVLAVQGWGAWPACSSKLGLR